MMTMRAPEPSAQAISTNCCSGIERERTSLSGEIFAPMRFNNSAARVRLAAQPTRRSDFAGSKRRPIFSATVKSGKSAGCW